VLVLGVAMAIVALAAASETMARWVASIVPAVLVAVLGALMMH